MCKHYLVEGFLLLGCADRVCRFAAMRTEEGFLLFLERKALNLRVVRSGRSSASRAVAIPFLSARASGGLPPLLSPPRRLLSRPQLNLFLLTRTQA